MTARNRINPRRLHVVLLIALLIGSSCRRPSAAESAGTRENSSDPCVKELGQREAATVMIGGLSLEAMFHAGDPNVKMPVSYSDDAAEYFKAAGFRDGPAEGLIAMLRQPTAGDVDQRMAVWNAMNGKLADEAERVCPGMGRKWLGLGTSAQFVHVTLEQCRPSVRDTDVDRALKLRAVRSVFGSPLGEALFQDARTLPLPGQLRDLVRDTEASDTSKPEEREAAANKIQLFVRLIRTVALRGTEAANSGAKNH